MKKANAFDGVEIKQALSFMCAALEILDRHGPFDAAATLSLAIEQAGGSSPRLSAADEI